MLQKLEDRLEEFYAKKVSYKLPEKFKKYFVSYMPWVMLVSGFFSAMATVTSYRAATATNKLTEYVNSINATYGATLVKDDLKLTLWVAVIFFACLSIFSFAAFSPLKARQKLGWKFLFWINLVYIAYDIYSVFASFNIGSFIVAIIIEAASLYVLFQVKSHYTAVKK